METGERKEGKMGRTKQPSGRQSEGRQKKREKLGVHLWFALFSKMSVKEKI